MARGYGFTSESKGGRCPFCDVFFMNAEHESMSYGSTLPRHTVEGMTCHGSGKKWYESPTEEEEDRFGEALLLKRVEKQLLASKAFLRRLATAMEKQKSTVNTPAHRARGGGR
jgi:hypothetical protein